VNTNYVKGGVSGPFDDTASAFALKKWEQWKHSG